MNRFKIHDSFAIQPDLFVFSGEIVEGNVARGMSFDVPEAGHRWRLIIYDISFIRKSGGAELTGLVVKNASPSYLPGLGAGWIAELREVLDE